MNKKREGFTLVEVLIVVVIMAVLAATIVPQFSDSSRDAKISTAQFNLSTLRGQIEMYKAQHNSIVPALGTLEELTKKTDVGGTIGTTAGTHIYGPYIRVIPSNPLNASNTVTVITNSPAVAGDVTGTGGWLYNKTTGEVWIDHADHFTE